MSTTGNQLPFNKSPTSVTPATKTAASLNPNPNDSDSCFQDISLCSSVPICRICHCSGEEEQLTHPCHCRGSVRYAHQSCLRTWIVGSGISSCELCNYKFRTKRKCIKDLRKVFANCFDERHYKSNGYDCRIYRVCVIFKKYKMFLHVYMLWYITTPKVARLEKSVTKIRAKASVF